MTNGTHAHYFDNRAHGDDAVLSRELNSDSVLDVVLDGVSTGVGSRASNLTIDKLNNGRVRNINDIVRLLQEANDELYDATRGVSLTTATTALKVGDQLYVVNVGDSPGYIVRNGKIIDLTTMDKVPNNPAVVTNVVGFGPDFDVHTKQLGLESYDKLVLVTDGVSDNLYPEEIARIVEHEKTPELAASALERLLNERLSSNKGREDVFGTFKSDDRAAVIRYLDTVGAQSLKDSTQAGSSHATLYDSAGNFLAQLDPGQRYTLGRSSDTDIVVGQDNRHVSRDHGSLINNGGLWVFRDNSSNGTAIQTDFLPYLESTISEVRDGNLQSYRMGKWHTNLDERRIGNEIPINRNADIYMAGKLHVTELVPGSYSVNIDSGTATKLRFQLPQGR